MQIYFFTIKCYNSRKISKFGFLNLKASSEPVTNDLLDGKVGMKMVPTYFVTWLRLKLYFNFNSNRYRENSKYNYMNSLRHKFTRFIVLYQIAIRF